MCITTSFVTVPPWNRPWCPSVGEGWYLVINEEKTADAHNNQEAEQRMTLSEKSQCEGLHTVFLFIQHS